MNILVSVNQAFIYPLKVLLFSLAETQSDTLNVYFLNLRLTTLEIQDLVIFCKKINVSFNCIDLSTDIKELLLTKESELNKNSLSMETYSRLFAPCLLLGLDRALWLDADCLVQKDIKDFYYQDLKENYIAACDQAQWDLPELSIEDYPRKLQGEYFNAGVILFDFKKCREMREFQYGKIKKLIYYFHGEHFDQGLLNWILQGRVQWCDSFQFNIGINQYWDHGLKDHPIQYQLYDNASILHYTSSNKPWNKPLYLEYDKAKYWLNIEQRMQNRLKENIPIIKMEYKKDL